MRRSVLPALLVVLATASTAPAQPLTTERVATGLSRPVFVTAPPGDFGRIFIVEQRSGTIGRVRIVKLNDPNGPTLLASPFLSVSPVSTGNEQGLLGLAFDPDYSSNGYFYINYTDSAGTTRIVRYTVSADPDIADATSAVAIITISQPFTNHNGGWIAFGPDGYLYIGTGDGGSANDPGNRAQNVNELLGKILRLDVSVDDPSIAGFYSIPPTNPYAGPTAGRDEIWAIGVRNPWRNAFDRFTGDLWIADVGQNAIEEINVQPAASGGGENYGWRCMEGNNCTGLTGCTCNSPALTYPIHTYSHAGGNCSITGGYVYRGVTMCSLRGTYFFADYCSNQIWSFRYVDGTVQQFTNRTAELDPPGPDTIASITSFGEDARGELYICAQAGDVWRIKSAAVVDRDADRDGALDARELRGGEAEVFQADIADFFQHQKWGKSTVAQPDPGADANWEAGTRAGGWCYYAAALNQLYRFKTKGFDTLPNGITGAGWLATFEAELPKLIDDIATLAAPDGRKVWNDRVNRVLKDRGVGPDNRVKEGLIRVEYYQSGDDVEYISSDGTSKVFAANSTLFKVLQTLITDGKAANLRLRKNPASTKLWWSGGAERNFHAVSVGGFDGAGKIYFADPDSNPDPGSNDGNEKANSGWSDKYSPNGLPNVNPIKKRRFDNASAIPAATANPTAQDKRRLFFEGILSADKKSLAIPAGVFDRYDGVEIQKLTTLEILCGANKPAPPPFVLGGPPLFYFEVSPGAAGALSIDEFWLFPGEASQILTGAIFFTGDANFSWEYELIAPGSVDPWGNIRPYGGAHIWTWDPCAVLNDADTLEFAYQPSNGQELQSWDLVLNLSSAGDGSALRLQTFGGGVDQTFDQELAPYFCPGDVNCSGTVDFDDIDFFVESLSYPLGVDWPNDCPWINADADGNGDVNFDDMDLFVALIGSICE